MSSAALVDDMGVHNVGFLIETLGADAGELQYLRELVQNSFESISKLKSDRSGRVEIDFELIKGVRKLRITDNGIGMTPDEVRANINNLSASGGEQAFDKNFGIGAKITAGTRNPHGLMFKTWKDGVGALTVLGRLNGRYGRIGFRNDVDSSVDYWLPLADEDKPDVISDSGVSVVLLGRADDDDTTVAPPGVDLQSQWVAAYLERRYFSIPANVTLKVKRPVEIYDAARDLRRSIYDTIQGQRYYLDKHSDAKDVCTLPDVGANVHWWLLNEEIVKGGKTWNNRGHVGAIYQGELYDVRDGAARVSALKDFGVYAGHGRVVIYVEPSVVLKANTPRTTLILPGNRQIDYAEIGAAFAEEMPDELAMYMAGQVSAEKGDHRKAIKKNLKEVEEAFQLVRFRRSKKGAIDSYEEDFGGIPSVGTTSPANGKTNPPRQQDEGTGRIGKEYLRKANEERDRQRGQRADTDPMPRIVWDETGATVPSGRAATYTKATHVVTANAKFGFFRDFVDWSFADARNRAISDIDDDTLLGICEDEVKRWFEQALTEAVVVLRPMAHDEKWGPSVFDTGLSDEGLTAAVISHRWHMMSAIKRGMAGRLGRTKESATPNHPR